jgi:dephospho-CoA kinase
MLWIGLTGGIGTGKSTVSQLLRADGYDVIDADVLAREVVQSGTPGFDEVVKLFGRETIGPDGQLDRKQIARIVFTNSSKLKSLESIIHPRVRVRVAQIRSELEARGRRFVFYDVPLLFEKQMQSQFDRTVVVTATPDQQLARLMLRDGLTQAEAQSRLAAQLPIEEKATLADDVIINEGDLEDLKNAVRGYLRQLELLNLPSPHKPE